jgi:hypothetical protein
MQSVNTPATVAEGAHCGTFRSCWAKSTDIATFGAHARHTQPLELILLGVPTVKQRMRLLKMVRNMIRFAADSLAGFAMFTGLTIGLLGPSAAADLVTQTPAANSVMLAGGFTAVSTAASQNLVVLAVVFSALFALNLAFIRHLRKAHAVSRPVNRPVKTLLLERQ